MTHGEEPGPETHQDSAVLTYLEGLLMHPVASGLGATATRRSEASSGNGHLGNQGTGGIQLPNHGSSPSEKISSPGTTSQHLKKARLLRSGAWNEPDNQKKDTSVMEVNGQGKEHHKAALESSGQGESTLLASLLQSFSSRLQNVALSQSITHNSHKQLDGESTSPDKNSLQSYCTASSRLKGLMRKNKQQNHHNTVPYRRLGSQDRCSESPRSSQGSAPGSAPDSVSCAERLKAVASLVKNRSSPAASPKPSMACSQLALLLSSEAHLQQYSREQALKAQLSGRSASERLAAIATQQTKDKAPTNMGESLMAPDMLSPLNVLNGTLPSPTFSSRSPSLPTMGSPRLSPHQPKEKRPFDRHISRPPQNCSSLLLLLLNNHNSQKHLTKNGHLEEDVTTLSGRASSHQSDSEYSNQENSLTKDTSDAESCYSSCSPIDLSMRCRVSSQKSEPLSNASSLDKLTQTFINKWKPESPGPKVPDTRELETSPDMKSHHKVTLMQLLLDRKNKEKINKNADNPDLQRDATLSDMVRGLPKRLSTPDESRQQNPLEHLMGRSLSEFSLSGDVSSSPSPSSYSYSSHLLQSGPLDLCKTKACSSEKMMEPAFSASKLLQNLAYCGLQNPSPSPPLLSQRPPSKRQSPEIEPDRPLLDRLAPPINRNRTPLFEPLPAPFTTFRQECSPPASAQIENLLERRNVLQLLLGTANHNEKSGGRKSTEAAMGAFEKSPGPSVICDSSNGPSMNIKIKTEPGEESLLLDGSDDGGRWRKWGHEGSSPLAEAHDRVKTEHCPAEAGATYGLLSQLLKQQTTTYPLSPHLKAPARTVKKEEERWDYQGPLLKKRKVCLELAEHLSNELCQRPLDTVTEHLASRTPEDPEDQARLPSPKEEEDSFVKSPTSKPPSRDCQGFNVLKQLLLSDNCLKELAQPPPRGTSSPFLPQANYKANGNFTRSPQLPNLPWFPPSHHSGPGAVVTSSPPPRKNSALGSPWEQCSPPKVSPTSVKRETLSSPRWMLGGEVKHESGVDSPPFSRSNPILYYMLQRGNGQLRKDMPDPGTDLRTIYGVTVKEEPGTETRYYEHRPNAMECSPVQGERLDHGGDYCNGSLQKL